METNMIKKIILCSVILISVKMLAEDPEIVEHNIISEQAEIGKEKFPSHQPLQGVEVLYNRVFKSKNKLLTEVKKNDFESSQTLQKSLVLGLDEFVYIKDFDTKMKLFNGSIIIKFNQLPDFNNFAIANEIIFVADLSDINRGVFKINNLYELEEVIKNLQLDNNILDIELDTIDLRIEPY